MKKNDVIKNKRCGIKLFEHVKSSKGLDSIISSTLEIYKRYPNTWKHTWDTVHWAFNNACMSLYREMDVKIRNNGQMSFNLDEVLTDEEIKYIAKELKILIPYYEVWKRD